MFKKPPPETPTPAIPKLDDAPAWQAAHKKFGELTGRGKILRAQIVEREQAVAAGRSHNGLAEQAEKYRSGTMVAEIAGSDTQMSTMKQELRLCDAAAKLQWAEVERIGREESERIVVGIVPQYEHILARLAAAILELQSAAEAELDFAMALQTAIGPGWVLLPRVWWPAALPARGPESSDSVRFLERLENTHPRAMELALSLKK